VDELVVIVDAANARHYVPEATLRMVGEDASPGHVSPRDLLSKHLLCPSSLERSLLSIQGLTICRDPGVTDDHFCPSILNAISAHQKPNDFSGSAVVHHC
jgi:hypothetical protein